MAWVYLDDHFPEHHKTLGAMEIHPLAPYLFICGLAYCRRNFSGGLIPALAIPNLMPKYAKNAKKALILVKLWDEMSDGAVQIHDYEEWNHSEARTAAARKAATIRWANTK